MLSFLGAFSWDLCFLTVIGAFFKWNGAYFKTSKLAVYTGNCYLMLSVFSNTGNSSPAASNNGPFYYTQTDFRFWSIIHSFTEKDIPTNTRDFHLSFRIECMKVKQNATFFRYKLTYTCIRSLVRWGWPAAQFLSEHSWNLRLLGQWKGTCARKLAWTWKHQCQAEAQWWGHSDFTQTSRNHSWVTSQVKKQFSRKTPKSGVGSK